MADRLLSAKRLPGKLLRAPLGLIPNGTRVPILFGPGKGLTWLAGSGPHSCWLGFNELGKRQLFARNVRSGHTMYDIGANVGYYSLMAAQWVGDCGYVIAVEPLQENLQWLRRHLAVNGLHNVVVEEVAAWVSNGHLRLKATPDRVTSHVHPSGDATVRTVTIDYLVANGRYPPPDHLKLDVEGAEFQVLQGAEQTLVEYKPTLFLATHGDKQRSDCRDFLERLTYSMQPIAGYHDEFIAKHISRR